MKAEAMKEKRGLRQLYFYLLPCCFLAVLSIAGPLCAADRIRAASGGFGTAINALAPGAYHQKVFQKYGLDVEYIAGKSVAISRFGSASDFAAVAALEKLGVGPKQVTLMQLGGNANRLAGLSGGSVQATVFSEPYASMAVKKFGMREAAAVGYDYYLVKHGDDILTLPDRKGLELVIADVAKTNSKAKRQTPESLKLLDPSILDEIRKSGFVEKMKHS
jgi:ABC-type nitrate/sulfonate/bicarbonate transport system substrate-binding protein